MIREIVFINKIVFSSDHLNSSEWRWIFELFNFFLFRFDLVVKIEFFQEIPLQSENLAQICFSLSLSQSDRRFQ